MNCTLPHQYTRRLFVPPPFVAYGPRPIRTPAHSQMATVGVWWRYSWCLLTAFATIKHYGAAAPSDCANKFDVHDDKIIRTEDSKKLGAKFIDSTEQRDRLECLELCCRTVRCDVFVFEEKVNLEL